MMANDHSIATSTGEQRARDLDTEGPYLVLGGDPTVPPSSLTLAAFEAQGYVERGDELSYVEQEAVAATIPDVDGTHWLALHDSVAEVVAGWTRTPTFSHYLLQQTANRPVDPVGGVVILKITVAASIVSAIEEIGTRWIRGVETISVVRTVGVEAEWVLGPRGRIVLDAALTFNGEFRAGIHAIFSGASTVIFGTNARVETYFPVWWGADPGASVAVNAAAINASLVAMPEKYARWRLTNGQFQTNAPIVFDTFQQASFTFDGEILNDGTTDAIQMRTISFCEFHHITALRFPFDWTGVQHAIHIDGPFDNNTLSIRFLAGYFGGIVLDSGPAAAGMHWNDFYGGRFIDTFRGILFLTSGSGSVNDNSFTGFAWKNSAAHGGGGSGDWAIYADPANTGSPEGNIRILFPSFEAVDNGVFAQGTKNWTIINPRFESTTFVTAIDWTGSRNFTLSMGSGDPEFEDLVILGSGDTRGLTISAAPKSSGGASQYKTLAGDTLFGGLTLFPPRDINSIATLGYDQTGAGYWITNSWQQPSHSGRLNKMFEGTGFPTNGTWAKNAVVWNTVVATTNIAFFVCSVLGTAGTLNGGATTATTTSGSNDIVVNSTTDMLIGQVITIAVDFAGARIITDIVGTTVTVSGAVATGSGAGRAVAFSSPTFINGPSYA